MPSSCFFWPAHSGQRVGAVWNGTGEETIVYDSFGTIPFDFVVSYNQEEKDAALSLVHRLEMQGLRGWLDARYYYVPIVSIENQLARAFERSRFIIVLIGDAYRESEWCQAEYNEGLDAEEALAIEVVLVAVTGNPRRIPRALEHCRRFHFASSDDIRNIGKFIMRRRQCHKGTSVPLRRLSTRWRAMRSVTSKYRPYLDEKRYAQLEAINDVCLWVLQALHATCENGKHETRLTVFGHSADSDREIVFDNRSFLEAAFTDDVYTDSYPFQRLLFDVLFFDHSVEDWERPLTLDRILWNQLLILSHASNRYFREQMLERAEWIVAERAFCVRDEDAQNHFVQCDGRGWVATVKENPLVGSRDRAPGKHQLATLCEHISLSEWRGNRKRSERLPETLPKDERVHLAGTAFARIFERFKAGGTAHAAPEGAVLLGLTTPGVHSEVHSSPSGALEQFHYTVATIVGRYEYQPLSCCCTLDRSVLETLQTELKLLIPIYMDYVDIAYNRERRCARSFKDAPQGYSFEYLRALWNFAISTPFTNMYNASIDLSELREIARSALNIFVVRGDQRARESASFIQGKLDAVGVEEVLLPLKIDIR
ncbi:hypothetical protein BG60_34080 [Caballeronia zhejiangensis]|uniref:TIR domain-containing protein n=1 Tax=Caballeronia zhejiangensis TaxID=871203 RepID=A0A656QAD9_9BURK|nr:hypothetical protein BG60_34080 [Caballeronia zhejiangensis]